MRTKALLRSEALRPAKLERGSPRTQSEEKDARRRNLFRDRRGQQRSRRGCAYREYPRWVGKTYLVAPMRERQRNAKMISRKKERERDKVGERA